MQDLIFFPVEGWVHSRHELVRTNDCGRHKSKFCIGVMVQFKTRLHYHHQVFKCNGKFQEGLNVSSFVDF